MSDQSEETPPSPNAEVGSGPEAFHILVVDDENELRHVLCELIEFEGYRVTGVSGGPEALKVLDESPVDLVITDLMMPGMNGWQLLDAISKRGLEVLVVVITGFMAEQGESVLTNRHVDAYLPKPIDHHRLRVTLRALLFAQNLGRPAEVVVVDDDEATIEAVNHALSNRGVFVSGFPAPAEAMQQIRKSPPDLLILDLLFPEGNGFDLCESIRSSSELAQIPVLILTAEPSRENVQRALDLRVSGFVAKPFDPKALAERVMKVLGQGGGKIEEA